MIEYLAGLFTLPALFVAYLVVDWAFSKNEGTGNCLVEWCKFKPLELGEHFNITVWASRMWHRWFAGPKHKRAVIAYWQARKDAGLPINPHAAKYMK